MIDLWQSRRQVLSAAFIILLIAADVVVAKKRIFPENIKRCKRTEDLNQCIIQRVEELRPRLNEGIPELQVPKFNPIVITKVSMDVGKTFRAEFNNIEVYGVDKFKLKEFNLDLERNTLNVDINFPHLNFICEYKLAGSLFFVELNGDGHVKANFSSINATSNITGYKMQREDGAEYLKFNETKLRLGIGPAKMKFDGLFKDNEELQKITDKLFDDNIQELVEELRPFIEETVGSVVFRLILRIFDLYSIDELFPNQLLR